MFRPIAAIAASNSPPPPTTTGIKPPSMRTRFPQFAAAVVVSLLHITHYGVVINTPDMYRNEWPEANELIHIGVAAQVIGASSFVIFAILFEKLNRKICAYTIGVAYIITGILQQFAKSYAFYGVVHSFQEFSIAGSKMISVIYITEISQNDIRGALLLVSPLVFNVTHALVVLVRHFATTYVSFSWFVIVPPLITILCFRFWLPESPVYLLRRDNRDAAVQSLRWLRGNASAEDVAEEIEDISEALKATNSDSQATTNIFQELFSRRSLAYCSIIIALAAADQFSGWSPITWALVILPIGHRLSSDIISPVKEVVYMLGTAIAMFVCDRKGRKPLLFSSLLICTLSLIPIAICLYVPGTLYDDELITSEVFVIIFCFIFLFGFSVGLTFLLPVVVADIFSPKLLNIVLAMKEIITGTLSCLVHYFIHTWNNDPTPLDFWISSAVCAAGCIVVAKLLPETKKRPAGFLFMDNRGHVLLRNI